MADSPLILIVDDSPIQRKIYANLLKSGGYDVIMAENGLQGVEMALQYFPALILMDIMMPEMDGLTATQELRQYTEMIDTPIVAITGTTDPSDIERALQAGYNEVIDKGSDKSIVLNTLSRLLT